MASTNKHFRGEWPYLAEHYECAETGEIPKVFSIEKYAVQAEEVRKANAKWEVGCSHSTDDNG